MTRSSVPIALTVAFFLTACGGLTAQPSERFEVELRVRLNQEDREFGGEGYTASYRHKVTVGLGGTEYQAELTESAWKGYETCQDPPLRIEFESEIDFEALRYNPPDLYALLRGPDVWFLYRTAREFGVQHPGRPGCEGASAIAPGSWVAKNFFSADLEEGAAPEGDLPAYDYDEGKAIGGFVLGVVPLSELESGKTRAFTTTHEAKSDVFEIALRVQVSVTPR